MKLELRYCLVRTVPKLTGHVGDESYAFREFFSSRVPIELTLLDQQILGGHTVRKIPYCFNGGRQGCRAGEPSARLE
jgi:hypothetical protein